MHDEVDPVAIAIGNRVVYGDVGDPLIWERIAMEGRRISVLTAPPRELSSQMPPIAQHFFSGLRWIAPVNDREEAARFANIGLMPVVNVGNLGGLDMTTEVLGELVVDPDAIVVWTWQQKERANCSSGEPRVAA